MFVSTSSSVHPENHVDLYASIEKILDSFMPMFELMFLSGNFQQQFTMSHDSSRELSLCPSVPCVVDLPQKETTVLLRGKNIQVTVKFAEIIQNPSISGRGYRRHWHLLHSCLPFRTNHHINKLLMTEWQLTYGHYNNDHLVQESSLESRCVVFPNWLQHRVQPFKLKDPENPTEGGQLQRNSPVVSLDASAM
ncbi:hypothetical protein P3T76_007135 [Phytophthora citrophthora]|uniref:Uncharacterized protein n=1 Tax=Phytophthora citrophthora TaxID=4793 RepID=A0AAD9GMR7_9STRA|nr:hypothetical protein P3T76_007135 [Phytophthora citrophthora]